jgi:hypothetical protein
MRIDELADRGITHWASLITDLLVNGETKKGYDKNNFFATSHVLNKSGANSNLLTTASIADPKNPGDANMEKAIKLSVKQLLTMLDEQGEPINEGARSFVVVVPVGLWDAAAAALKANVIIESGAARTNLLVTLSNLTFLLVPNARLDAKGSGATAWWGTSASRFVVLRGDAPIKPFIRLQTMPVDGPGVNVMALGPESEHSKKTHKVLFGVDARRGAGYGYHQLAVLHKFTT